MSSNLKCYYEVLSVSRTATDVEIKKSFRRLAMKYHPDRNPGDKEAEANFKEAKKAYEVLSDPQKRAAYDQFGHAGVDQQAAAGGGDHGFSGFGDINDIFENIFSDAFGGRNRGGGQRERQGRDLGYDLSITLEEAFHGVSKTIEVPCWETCKSCEGSGAKKGSAPVDCSTCKGAGEVRINHGFLRMQQTCPHCHGNGKVIKDVCRDCRGEGRKQKTQNLNVNIPAGVDSGDRVRLGGKGEAGINGGPAGDLYVQIYLKDHPIFKRDGADLYSEVPIDFATAALGGDIEIPTISGHSKLTIPAETQSGQLFRLRGKGIKALRGGGTGDLLCRVSVETPVKLTAEQKTLLRNFSDALLNDKKNHSPRSRSWFDAVKDFFSDKKS